MVCKEVIRQLSEYLDGELDPAVVQELTRHLEHCEDCGLVVDTTRKTVELYCNTEPVALPKEVGERLNRFLAEKLVPKPSERP